LIYIHPSYKKSVEKGMLSIIKKDKMGDINLGGKYHKANMNDLPFGIELSFLTDNVAAAFEKAIAAGAVPIKEPEEKPWGQVVSYVRSIDGTIIEIATSISE
jgi:lactoylglutathione lyase